MYISFNLIVKYEKRKNSINLIAELNYDKGIKRQGEPLKFICMIF
jgi:hypothetical protein